MAEQEQTVATQAGNELTAESGNVQANFLNETTRTSTTPHQPPDDDEPPHDNEPQQNKSKATQDQIAKLGDSLEGLVQRTVNARQRQVANLLEDSWAGMEVGKPGPQVRETPRSQDAVQVASQLTLRTNFSSELERQQLRRQPELTRAAARARLYTGAADGMATGWACSYRGAFAYAAARHIGLVDPVGENIASRRQPWRWTRWIWDQRDLADPFGAPVPVGLPTADDARVGHGVWWVIHGLGPLPYEQDEQELTTWNAMPCPSQTVASDA